MQDLNARLSRRGLILGLAALTASCATASRKTVATTPVATGPSVLDVPTAPLAVPSAPTRVALDPKGLIRKELLDQAMAAFDRHGDRIPVKDEIYLVDFQKHSSKERLYRLDLKTGEVEAWRTAHGRNSDPGHTGFATRFSNIKDSGESSVGAYVTAGQSSGAKHGANVLLDGLDPTNDEARDRAIIVHAADYCEPSYLASQGKLGRSLGCFALSSADLRALRPRLDKGRLLYASAV